MLCLFNSMVSMCAPLARVHDTYKVFADQRNRQFLVVGDAVLWEKVAAEGKATSALLQHRSGKDICGYELNDAALNRALRAALRTHLDRQTVQRTSSSVARRVKPACRQSWPCRPCWLPSAPWTRRRGTS